jgi:hypothetical protein
MQNVKVTSFDLRTSDNTVLASTYGRGFFTGQFNADVNAVVQNLVDNNSIYIYPTASSSGDFNIKSNKNIGQVDLSVFNVRGQLVNKHELDLGIGLSDFSLNLKSGVYFVRINNDKTTYSQKIIIK